MRLRFLLAGGSVVALALGQIATGRGREAAERRPPDASRPAENAARFRSLGSGSCAASACHGAPEAVTGSAVLRNEYTTWLERDPHARASIVLNDPLAATIMRNLRANDTGARCYRERAYDEPLCLACHATPAGSDFTIGVPTAALRREGVGCEACHGPASQWASQHTRTDWPHDDRARAARGMQPLRELPDRATRCVQCHIGSPDSAGPICGRTVREVNHDLIAAGHPRLDFELATFLELMPRHWREDWEHQSDPAERRRAGAEFRSRTWLVGQLATAEASVRLLESCATRATRGEGPWPEFTEYGCASCHHDLRPAGASRTSLANDRPLGSPAWGSWPLAMMPELLPLAELSLR